LNNEQALRIKMISYSQNGEDVVLMRVLSHVRRGFYIDIGAGHPTFDSVTKNFYDAGWRGVNVEPDSRLYPILKGSRERDNNLFACVSTSLEKSNFWQALTVGWSTTNPEVAGEIANIQNVDMEIRESVSLDELLKVNEDIHFLKIDCEGDELAILRSSSFAGNRPWIIIVETRIPRKSSSKYNEIEEVLCARNYAPVFFDGLNHYFVDKAHSSLILSDKWYPACVLDQYKGFNDLQDYEIVKNELYQAKIEKDEALKSLHKTEELHTLTISSLNNELNISIASAEIAEARLIKEQELRESAEARLIKEQELRELAQHARLLSESELNQLKNTLLFRRTLKMRRLYFLLRENYINKYLSVSTLNLRGSTFTFLICSIAKKCAKVIGKNSITRLLASKFLSTFPKIRRLTFKVLTYSPTPTVTNLGSLRLSPSNLDRKIEDSFVISETEKVIFLYVEHTSGFNRVTGVQRVVYKLAANLLAHDVSLILVILGTDLELKPLPKNELTNFAKNAGCPELLDKLDFYDDSTFAELLSTMKNRRVKSWLVVPEVTYHTTHIKQPTNRLVKLCRDLGIKIGFIFYDSIPFVSEDAKSSAKEHARYLSTLALADAIWPISSYSALHLADYFEKVEMLEENEFPEITTIELASDMETQRIISTEPNSNHMLLSVGTIDARKNQVTLVKAFNQYCKKYPETDWQLYIVGLIRDDYKDVFEAETRMNNRIKIFYDASDDKVAEFYKLCDFTVFPSTEEGYGLPIVESLWSFKPCITAKFGAMAEIAKLGGCLMVDTYDVNEICESIEKLIHEPGLRELKKTEMLSRRTSTWFEYAGRLLAHTDESTSNLSQYGRIFYWVDATIGAPGNTGIQRVCRILARELLSLGLHLVPIKWNSKLGEIELASSSDLSYFANWNGPSPDQWTMTVNLNQVHENDRYLMVDLPLNRDLEIQRSVLRFFKKSGVQTSAIFYDAIPHKLAELYPEPFTYAHRQYMDILDSVDKVLAISSHSRNDLIDYINSSKNRGLNIEQRVVCVELPTQFPGGHTNFEKKEIRPEGICTILSVGTVEPRKNHETLIKAFLLAEKNSKRQIKLIILGSDSSFDPDLPKRIEKLIGESKNITWIKDASDEVLRKCYEQASFTIYPSYEEGFGLPIAESLWFGLPCICADFGQMKEIAIKGGCLLTNVLSVDHLSESILLLANDYEEYKSLQHQIRTRHFKTWAEYALDINKVLFSDRFQKPLIEEQSQKISPVVYINRPVISIVISTFNRSGWLEVNLANLQNLISKFGDKIEVIVCDNHSTDQTQDVLARFLSNEKIKSYRNSANVGMLGNLSESVALADGDYIWLIGDDDLIREGAIEKILEVIKFHSPELIYLNYAYSTLHAPPNFADLDPYHLNATKMTLDTQDKKSSISEFTALNENFFTAIYTFVTKKKHAQRIFNQDTSGSPFTSLQNCVPTSKYILENMLSMEGFWVAEPLITINMNVSWGDFSPIWILERLPEVYDLAEFHGIEREKVDFWRNHTLKMYLDVFKGIFATEDVSKIQSIDLRAIPRRMRHLAEFNKTTSEMTKIYELARNSNHPLAVLTTEEFEEYYRA